MGDTQRELLLMLAYSPVVGAFLGLVFDVFRILRIAAGGKSGGRAGQAVVFIEDVVFAAVCGIVTVLYSYCQNDGKIRFFAIAGMAAGFALYYATVGRVVIYFSEKIISAVMSAVAFILRITVKPVVGAVKRLYKAVHSALLYKIRKKRTAVHFNEMMKNARNGFRS